MAAKLVVTFEVPKGVSIADVKYVVNDALSEFVAARDPVEPYVEKRYASQNVTFQRRKIQEVCKRIDIANTMKHTVEFSVPIVE
jgi:hypothetical protein